MIPGNAENHPPPPSSADLPDTTPRPVEEILRDAAAQLVPVVGDDARFEAEVLLEHASGRSRTSFHAWPERLLSTEEIDRFRHCLQRRCQGEPVAYIRGRQEFWSLDLTVTPDTLIPRPDTELLVETTLDCLDARAALTLADLGTGSGAIAAALASERPHWCILATDRAFATLQVAHANFIRHQLPVTPLQADWLAPFASDSLDAIISNPPYIAGDDPHLRHGDLRFEPSQALTPGGDGLDCLRTIARESMRCLKPGGYVLVEHGHDQGSAARELFLSAGLEDVETRQDLAGHERVTLGRRG